MQRGNAPAALANYQDALSVIERSGAHSYIGMAWLGIGEALIELGRLDAAQVALDKTVNLQGNLPQTQLALSTTCALAQLAYGHNQLAQAMELVYDILAVASLHDYEYGADLPPILWKCYQIAHVVGDKCATSILQMAYRLVQAQATSVEDTALHQSFLTQVKLNREIVTAFDEPT